MGNCYLKYTKRLSIYLCVSVCKTFWTVRKIFTYIVAILYPTNTIAFNQTNLAKNLLQTRGKYWCILKTVLIHLNCYCVSKLNTYLRSTGCEHWIVYGFNVRNFWHICRQVAKEVRNIKTTTSCNKLFKQ